MVAWNDHHLLGRWLRGAEAGEERIEACVAIELVSLREVAADHHRIEGPPLLAQRDTKGGESVSQVVQITDAHVLAGLELVFVVLLTRRGATEMKVRKVENQRHSASIPHFGGNESRRGAGSG